jgi:hypothetical protein
MQARIYQTSPSPTQSGTGIKKWALDFTASHKTIDGTMGWSASNETMPQVKLYFDSQKDAEEFAQSNGWDIEVIAQNNNHKFVKKSYAENFMD